MKMSLFVCLSVSVSVSLVRCIARLVLAQRLTHSLLVALRVAHGVHKHFCEVDPPVEHLLDEVHRRLMRQLVERAWRHLSHSTYVRVSARQQ